MSLQIDSPEVFTTNCKVAHVVRVFRDRRDSNLRNENSKRRLQMTKSVTKKVTRGVRSGAVFSEQTAFPFNLFPEYEFVKYRRENSIGFESN